MTTTDLSERGLESLIFETLTSGPSDEGRLFAETELAYDTRHYLPGNPIDYDRINRVDLAHLLAFLETTQPEVVEQFNLNTTGSSRDQFLYRLSTEVAKRGIVDVLRKGIKHGPAQVDLFFGTPTPGNDEAARLHALNRFSVTRQLRYSPDETANALDLALFVNGLPVATFELKNNLTKQTVDDAIRQYKTDRSPQEPLFKTGQTLAHFAVDEHQVWYATALRGPNTWFLPFNKGYQSGSGNPPNPAGLMTDYLWREVLTPDGLTRIIEKFALLIEQKDDAGKKRQVQIFPRYHQLDVVGKLLADVWQKGVGQRYLVQHSAGSGKSNSIAWLAHQLVELKRDTQPVFDSIIVVTDRVILDQQIRDTVKQFSQVGSTVGWADKSITLRQDLEGGKKIIISTVQKFPFILQEMESSLADHSYAIIIDEAHSSQGGKTGTAMGSVLGGADDEDDEDLEDKINNIIANRKMLKNASYFAFTATPKNRTLELFGTPVPGTDQRAPFHTYSMKQAIEEGFILDVLGSYTPVKSYYHVTRTIEEDREFDSKKAKRKIKTWVEGHPAAIQIKSEIIAEHFLTSTRHKINGKARAMVVANGIERAIKYWDALSAELKRMQSPYRAIVAFSGEHEWKGQSVTEAFLNKFPSNEIREKIKEDPYRLLVVADKFQTGYDEPLLHTMYVDKPLSGVRAVQTLSRLNRAMPGKVDTFVLDFFNDTDTIRDAFQTYYQTTMLTGESDPNKLHDLKDQLDQAEVYEWEQVEEFVRRFLAGEPRSALQPLLDRSVVNFIALAKEEEGVERQIRFKHGAKTFVRSYNFLAQILPYGHVEWEMLGTFLTWLTPSLPSPDIEDLSVGVLQAIDMDSYRAERGNAMKVALENADENLVPPPTSGNSQLPIPELENLSAIVREFNELFGNIEWTDDDRVLRIITEELPAKVAADERYHNAIAQGDQDNARIEHDRALSDAILSLITDDTEIFKRFQDDPAFKRKLSEMNFRATYSQPAP